MNFWKILLKKRFPLLLFLVSLPLFSQRIPQDVEELSRDISARIALLMDVETGQILYSRNIHEIHAPASMLKVATLNMAYRLLEEQNRSIEEVIEIKEGEDALSRPSDSSLMHLAIGDRVTIRELMEGVAVLSGNDAAYALAIELGGGVYPFINRLNGFSTLRKWSDLLFTDPDGYNDENRITAFDYAWLVRDYIKNYPQALSDLHSVVEMSYPQKKNAYDFREREIITKKNTNLLLGVVEGVDGLKTGYTELAGWNFAGTAKRGERRLLGIVMGIYSWNGRAMRAEEVRVLLEYGFAHYQTFRHTLSKEYTIPLLRGQSTSVRVRQNRPFAITLDKNILQDEIKISLKAPNRLIAPLSEETVVGYVDYSYRGEFLGSRLLYPAKEYPLGSWLSSVWGQVKGWFSKERWETLSAPVSLDLF